MATILADVLAGGAAAAGGWLFGEVTHVNTLVKKLHRRTKKLEMKAP
jgi:hypothetical protein